VTTDISLQIEWRVQPADAVKSKVARQLFSYSKICSIHSWNGTERGKEMPVTVQLSLRPLRGHFKPVYIDVVQRYCMSMQSAWILYVSRSVYSLGKLISKTETPTNSPLPTILPCWRLLEITGDYRRLLITGDYRRLLITGDCKGLLGITGDYKWLLEITSDYWRLLGITGDYCMYIH